jgi:thiol-disulfide isomerase/thioredoxin
VSHSPADAEKLADARDPRSTYRRQLSHLDFLINHGGSLSGYERHCAFLHLGTAADGLPTFATVSAATGFDFLDDGRALGLVDWDTDGDTDVWTMNRTGPRVRYLRNEQRGGNGYLSLRLVGNTCNRDAIGARVEVLLDESGHPRTLTKTVRAGEGFLAQSSKWLHLGLGHASAIRNVAVHWPGGERQVFSELIANSRYQLEQGVLHPMRLEPLDAPSLDRAVQVQSPPVTEEAAVLLASRIPLPDMPYRDLANQDDSLGRFAGRPILVNLWATWCVPCQRELQEFTEHAEKMERTGLQIVALSLDGLGGDDSTNSGPGDPAAAQRIFRDLHSTIHRGWATQELLERFQFLEDFLFTQKRPIAMPTSYLVDEEGRLAGIYRGPIDVSRLAGDVQTIRRSGQALYDAVLPFSGTWYQPRQVQAPIQFAAKMFQRGFAEDAANYLLRRQDAMKTQAGFAALAGQLGSAMAKARHTSIAIELYQAALSANPDNVAVMNNLAWHLATHEDVAQRRPADAVRWAERAASLSNSADLDVLDTLIVAYEQSRRLTDALRIARQCLELAERQGKLEYAAKWRAKIRQWETKKP